MANKQGVVSTALREKQPATHVPSNVLSLEPIQLQQQTIFMEQAAEQPDQASPDDMLKLHHRFGNTQVQRALDEEQPGSLPVNRHGELSQHVAREIQRARSGGSPLPGPLHRQVSQELQGDFSQVRLHTDRQADRLSGQLQVRAFTLGNNIFFRQGAYAPHSARGRHTLLHELTHVMQQSGSPEAAGPLKLGPAGDRFEQAADRTADHSAARQSGVSAARSVQRAVVQREGGNTAPATTSQPQRRWPRRALPALPPQAQQPGPVVNQPSTAQNLGSPVVQPPVQQPPVQQPVVSPPQQNPQVSPQQNPPRRQSFPPPPQRRAPAPPNRQTTTNAQPAVQQPSVNQPVAPQQNQATPPQNPIPEALKKLGMIQATWNALSPTKRTIMEAMAGDRKDYTQQLIHLADRTKWPLDGSDAEILSAPTIKSIPAVLKINLNGWVGLKKEYRSALLSLSVKPYIVQLGIQANRNNWPKNGAGAEIYDAAGLDRIINLHKLSFEKWNVITNDLRTILEGIPESDPENASQLGAAAVNLHWPADRASGHLPYADWVNLKKADPGITPEKWNSLDTATRTGVLDAASDIDRKRLLGQADYKKDKEAGGVEHLLKITDNPIFSPISDTISSGLSIGSNAAQLVEGENGSKVVSSSIGVTGAGWDTLVQGASLLGNLGRWSRGSRMAGRKNASRAAKTLGAKERREGMWGSASAALGLGGSISSMAGHSSKLYNQEADAASGFSRGADISSGSFATASGALGATRGIIGMAQGFNRSSESEKFVDKNATGDDKELSDIASFTSKNQKRLGKSLDTVKNLFTMGGGISNIVGGTGGTISSAVFSGLGLLTGLANAGLSALYKPKEVDLTAKADKLIDLVRRHNAKAEKFMRDVLKINEPNLVEWLDEDPDAARDLIKSKLSKY